MGGGGKAPSVPDVQVRSIGDIYSGSVNASINALPQLLSAYQQYGPQYANAVSDLFIQNQKKLKDAYPEQYRVLEPLSQGIASNLQDLNAAGGSGMPPALQAYYQNQIRGSQAARGIAESPVSALSEAQYLGANAEDYRQNVTGEALQFMGIPPLTVPGSETSINTLGLTPSTPGQLTQTDAQVLEPMRVQNAYDQYALQMQEYNANRARRAGLGRAIGATAGAALAVGAAPFTGGASLAFIPQASQLGGSVGQVGGTYF